MSGERGGFTVIFLTESRRLLRSRKLKVLFLITFFPALIYLLNPSPSGNGLDAMRKAFQGLMVDLIPNYWLGIIGELIAIILMSDLLAGEIDRGTIRLLIARPVKFSEIVGAKFAGGMVALTALFGIPYLAIWLYSALVYRTGLSGLSGSLPDFLLSLGATLLVVAALGSLALFVSALITRPLYSALATFGVLFLVQFLIPQIPYIQNPERYTLGYQTVVLLKAGFNKVDLSSFTGTPWHVAAFFSVLVAAFLFLTWLVLSRREFPE